MKRSLKKKSPLSIVIDVVLSLVMVLMGVVIVNSVVEKTTNKSMFGSHIVWIYTGSMEETIPAGSYVLTKDTKPEEIQKNDIITFIVDDPTSPINGQQNTHRVVEINGDEFVTKGDANIDTDKPIRADQIVAKYVKNMPVLTFFRRLYASPAGYVVTMVLIVGLVSLWFVLDAKDRRKNKEFEELVKEEVKRLEKEGLDKDKN